jgi:hypothetical protein
LPPRGTVSDLAARAGWRLMQWRQRKFAERLSEQQTEPPRLAA